MCYSTPFLGSKDQLVSEIMTKETIKISIFCDESAESVHKHHVHCESCVAIYFLQKEKTICFEDKIADFLKV